MAGKVTGRIHYPKTYEECFEIIYGKVSPYSRIVAVRNDGFKGELMTDLQRLLFCRAAYWKIAGKQMGLDGPWEPDWTDLNQDKFVLVFEGNSPIKYRYTIQHKILAFPTQEMLDAFCTWFADLIESCKECL